MKRVFLIGLLGAGLSGCVAIDASGSGAGGEIERLAKDCRARGGILIPTNANSGNEAANWACDIRSSGKITR